MPESKTIRCAKCHIEMSIRQFVAHRTGNGVACARVPCPVCGGPVGEGAVIAHGMAVCARFCAEKLHMRPRIREDVRIVDDQLAAMRRAEKLPKPYQRPTRAS